MNYLRKIKTVIKSYLDIQTKILVKNSSWVFVAHGTRIGLVFIRSVIIARGLGVEMYGTYAVILAFVTAIPEFFNLNLGTALIKFGAEYHVESRNDKLIALLKSCLLFTGVTALLGIITILIVLLFAYDQFIFYPNLTLIIVILAASVSLSSFDYIIQSFLRLFYKFRLNSVIQIMMAIIEVAIIGIALFYFPGNLVYLIFSVIIGKILSSSVGNGFAIFEVRNKIFPYLKSKMRILSVDKNRILKFALANSGSRTLKTVMDQGDVLLLGSLSSTTQVGIYSISKKLGYSILLLVDPLINAVFPQFSKLISERKYSEIKVMIKKVNLIISLISLIALIAIIFFRYDLVFILYGNEYSGAENPLIIHVITALISAVFFWSLSLILSLALTTFRLFASIISLTTGTVLAVVLTPDYGAMGTAIGLMAAKVSLSVFYSIKSWNVIKVNENNTR